MGLDFAPHLVGRARLKKACPQPSSWCVSRAKRAFDLAIAVPVLAVAGLPMVAIGLCIRLSSKGPAIFVQERVGRHGRLFKIFKFRSMRMDAAEGPGLTKDGDSRITPIGRWLRKLKLDELPQFYNVLRGDLSLVGPRPKLPQYEVNFNMQCRPGITGASTLLFRNEEEILSRVSPSEIESFYARRIKPLKARIDTRYMRKAALSSDLKILAGTLFSCIAPEMGRAALSPKPARRVRSGAPRRVRDTAREPLLAGAHAIPSESSGAD
ncbi:MAG: sugar transferase [Acidobacteriota bacterium]